MWIRQCDLDAQNEAPSPIPTRIASNEEFIPPPQTPEQKQVTVHCVRSSVGAGWP